MVKKRFLIFGVVLTLFLSVFVSCLDDNDSSRNIFRFIYEPVLIKSEGSNITMKTQYGDILAPQLSKANPGEYYLTNFLMDTTMHPYKAFGLDCKRMGTDTLHIFSELTGIIDEYDVPIADVKIYLKDPHADNLLRLKNSPSLFNFICIDSTFFVEPVFADTDMRKAAYELILFTIPDSVDPVSKNPVLYLRAKKTNREISRMCYALNLSTGGQSLFPTFATTGVNSVQFDLKFNSGDGYKSYKANPVRLSWK